MYASEVEYIFYALPITQQLTPNSQINIALKKFCSGHATAELPRECKVKYHAIWVEFQVRGSPHVHLFL